MANTGGAIVEEQITTFAIITLHLSLYLCR